MLVFLRRKRQLPFRNPPSVLLPPELWEYIATFLDLQDLSQLYLLSHAFYDAFLTCRFRYISLVISDPRSCQIKKHLALLRAIRNPAINKKILEIEFDSQWEANLISALDFAGWKSYIPRSWSRLALTLRGRTDQAKTRTIQHTIYEAASMLSNITHLSVHLHHGPMPNPNVLRTLWTDCSQTLIDLTLILDRHLLTPDHAFGGGMTCPKLRSLHVTVVADYPELLRDVRSLIPEDGGCLEYFSFSLENCQTQFGSASFQSLQKLRIEGDRTAMPSLLPFVDSHRDKLREVTLAESSSMDLRNLTILNSSILTLLSIGIDPLFKHQAEMLPFLSCSPCLRTLSLSQRDHRYLMKEHSADRMPLFTKLLHFLPPSLTHLTVPELIIDFKLFLHIFQQLPNISSLELCYCYPASEAILDLINPRPVNSAPRWSFLPEIAWTVQFEDLQASLKVLAQGPLCERDPESISELFFESKTSTRSCFNCLRSNYPLTTYQSQG